MDIQLNQIISELSKIDAAVANIFAGADTEKKNYEVFIKEKTAEFDKSLEDDIEKELNLYEKKLREENENQLGKIKSAADTDMKKLDKAYSENHEKWADEIFKSITEKRS